MSRELVDQLIEKKRALNAEIVRLETEYSQLHQNHAWLMNEDLANDFPELDDKELAIKEELLNLNLSVLRNKARLKLADFFGLSYARSFIPTLCIVCFVDHDKRKSSMVEVKLDPNFWEGKKQYECPICKHVLRVDPTLNIQ